MPRRLFSSAALPLLLCVLICCGSYGAEANANDGGTSSRVVLFDAGVTEMTDPASPSNKQKFESFSAPSLVYVNGVVVAFAEAHYTNATENKPYVGVAARWKKADATPWAEGSAVVVDHYDAKVYRLLRPTAFVDESEVHLLLGGYGETGAPFTAETAAGYWKPRGASGRVSGDDDEGFEWHEQSTSPIPYDFDFKGFKEFLGGGGAGIRLGDNTFVLPVQALKADGKRVSLVVLARGTSYGWKFSEGTSHDGCVLPAVLEWGGAGGLLM
ncbi:trans-sialidase, partial [Trypanosoma conorhini]